MIPGSGNPDWVEIENAIVAVLELPEEKRTAYLSQQPPSVRAEVESLLAAYRRSGSFLGDEPGKPAVTAELIVRMKAMLEAANSEVEDGAGSRKPVALGAGAQVGQYRIVDVIGRGGMGIVYRALDTKLNRPVAVKFLSGDVADLAARRRFQREAQMASSLNHPHILTVYDAGDFDGRQYLVTEFVDGGTLTDWAREKKGTFRDSVALLLGVADGLAAAHGAGILHRDIKPDNILVGKNGYAKLSDFGLAKLQESVSQETATQTAATSTGPGLILGTIPYMSPEQASGMPTDPRSDIFSFGTVLYEMLAGKRPFTGASDLETLHTIIQGSVPPLPAEIPYGLRMVVEKALEKSPADRYQSAKDLVVDLRRATRQSGESTGPGTPTPQAASPAGSKITWKFGALAAILVIALLAGGVLLWRLQRPAAQAPRQVVQFDISPPPGTIFAPPVSRQPFAISPDGKRLAFSATSASGTNIWMRDLASPDMHAVPGTDGVWSMFWAPDSRSIFFSVKKTLKQVNLDTGSGRTIAELPNIPRLGTWRSNGDLLLFLGGGQIYELRVEDGSLRKAPDFSNISQTNAADITALSWPQFLPGVDRLVYTVGDKALQHSRVVVSDYVNGKPLALTQTDSRVQYASPLRPGEPGYLLFIRGSSLLAQPFDPIQLTLGGEPFPIAQNVVYYSSNLAASFSVSSNGVLVYQASFPTSELKWYDRVGKEVGQAGRPTTHWGQVRASRDGLRVAATVWNPEDGGTQIWIFDANGRESRSLAFPRQIDRRPVWSPDGKRLASGRSPTVGGSHLAIFDIASSKEEGFVNTLPKEHVSAVLPTDWSWDGRFIAFDDGIGEEQHSVWIADVDAHTIAPFLDSNHPQWGAAFSRDGKWTALVSLESGRPEVYVQAFEAAPSPHVTGDRRQISRDGAWLVRWRADGHELFYVGLDNVLHAVAVMGPLQFGEPKPLFRIAGAPQYGTTRDFQFDVSPDGQRFIFPTTGSVAPPPYTVIENWQDKFRH